MMTFFTILLVLIGLNVAMVIASMKNVSKKMKKPTANISKSTNTIIYPVDLITSSYKKAV